MLQRRKRSADESRVLRGSYEESNPYDRGAAGEADSVCESAAYVVEPFTGTVQYFRCRHRRSLRGLDGARFRGIHEYLRHAVYGFPDRSRRRNQCAGRALLRGGTCEGCEEDGRGVAHHQSGRRRDPSARRTLRVACAAPDHPHEAGSAAGRGHVPAGLLPRYAGARAVQLRQRGLQRDR